MRGSYHGRVRLPDGNFLSKSRRRCPNCERRVTVFNRTVENWLKKAPSSSETLRQHTSYALCTLSVQLDSIVHSSLTGHRLFCEVFFKNESCETDSGNFNRKVCFKQATEIFLTGNLVPVRRFLQLNRYGLLVLFDVVPFTKRMPALRNHLNLNFSLRHRRHFHRAVLIRF